MKLVRKRLPYIASHIKNGETVLEIGASNRGIEKRLRTFHPQLRYKSMDIDTSHPQDYYSLEEIRESFDVILLFEVIEHLDMEDGGAMAAAIYRMLNPGGRVILSTPNTYTPGQFWSGLDHRTAYHYAELGGLFLSQGFTIVDMRRVHNDPLVQYVLKGYLLSPLFRFLKLDYAKSILLVARKD